jgi:hypothetical protein
MTVSHPVSFGIEEKKVIKIFMIVFSNEKEKKKDLYDS